jgi:hypothetical protein
VSRQDGPAATPGTCRVWRIFQARCLTCDWNGEMTSDRREATADARAHRATIDHRKRDRDRRAR